MNAELYTGVCVRAVVSPCVFVQFLVLVLLFRRNNLFFPTCIAFLGFPLNNPPSTISPGPFSVLTISVAILWDKLKVFFQVQYCQNLLHGILVFHICSTYRQVVRYCCLLFIFPDRVIYFSHLNLVFSSRLKTVLV